MVINTNLNAMNAYRSMGIASTKQGLAMEKLSSGNRINRAADDAAGLAISEKMRSQINGLVQASRNAQDGVSMIQTAEGELSETQAINQRMKELAVQSANGIYEEEDRKLINQEFKQLKKEIDRIANETEFSGSKLLNGDRSGKEIVAKQGVNKATEGKDVVKGTKIGKAVYNETNLKALLKESIKEEDAIKLGEGEFKIQVTVGNTTPVDGVKDNELRIELIDSSKFNDGKEYVMDSKIISTANGGKDKKINLAGIEFTLDTTPANITSDKGNSGWLSFKNEIKEKTDETKLQVGASGDQSIGFDIDYMRARELGLGGVEIGTAEKAKEAITSVDEAIKRVSSQRANLGATQNRLEHTIAANDNTAENLQAAESRIRDVDMAKEMMNLTKLNILQQASQAMLSQAKQALNQVLSMLR